MTKRLYMLLMLCIGCGTTEHWYFLKTEYQHPVEWNYADEGNGPGQWADLSPAFVIAREGKKQSPININVPHAKVAPLAPVTYHYREEAVVYVNDGFALLGGGNWIEWDGVRYHLERYQFHTPSEHTVNDQHAPMEIQLVHKAGEGPEAKYVIVAVLVERGVQNELLDDAVRVLLQEREGTIDPARVLPENHDYFFYEGSFTAPPCTEGVKWIVLRERIRVPSTVLGRIREVTGKNNRPVQALYGRRVQVGR